MSKWISSVLGGVGGPMVFLVLMAVVGTGRADDPGTGGTGSAAVRTKKIVLLAGKKSHGPGVHEYEKSVKLLKVMLDGASNVLNVRTEIHFDGWPEDPRTLDDADTIMTISDGQDGDKFSPVPWMTPERMPVIERQMQRGCGFVTFHFSTFTPDVYGRQILEWGGGYFDWQNDLGNHEWYSAIRTLEADVHTAEDHPITRGLKPFRFRDEFYYKIRFRDGDERLKPILWVPELGGTTREQVVAWAVERKEGGRGFGTTTGHFFDNWQDANYRRLILNAILWTAGADVPDGGVDAEYVADDEVNRRLAGEPIKAAIVTGHQYPGHLWRETSVALEDALRVDPRMEVTSIPDPEFLARPELHDYDVILFNYCNWEQPQGITDAAKAGFVRYLREGGGLVLVHFSNGAFHFSLPKAGESDWPEYRNICRRVWNHQGQSGHDAYGPFTVDISDREHPITRGMTPFETIDELYFRQEGDQPVHVIATARSKVTGRDEPMAFVHDYGQGRVFQTVLGHAAESLQTDGARELVRRGAVWAAGREQLSNHLLHRRTAPAATGALPPQQLPLVEGRFGKALDARVSGAFVPASTLLRDPPLTVECWAKLASRESFNILVAQELKSSATHWELFSMPESGHLTAYLPGMAPDHVRSITDICDGRWHYIAMQYESNRIRLFVDGSKVADQPIRFVGGQPESGEFGIGSLPSRDIGCNGCVDEVRISRGRRDVSSVPDSPFAVDQETYGLWHLDEIDARGRTPDAASRHSPARLVVAGTERINVQMPARVTGHWGESETGIRWAEDYSVDDRWNRMDVGPFLAASVATPEDLTLKGLSIKVGQPHLGTMCFDTQHLVMRAGWWDGFLKFDPARYGLIRHPQIDGKVAFSLRGAPPWTEQPHRFQGTYVHGSRAVISYRISRSDILESPWVASHGDARALVRTIEITRPSFPTFPVLDDIHSVERRAVGQASVIRFHRGETAGAVALVGSGADLVARGSDGSLVVRLDQNRDLLAFRLLHWSGPPAEFADFERLITALAPAEKLADWIQPGPARWTESITTQGFTSDLNEPLVIDTLTLPFDNPYGALMFVGGHDFLSNGNAALCTVHGDVWIVSGLDQTLERLTWKRFATGLFQPLGLKVVDDVIYVVGKDQITRLHDRDGNGEADYYENFNNAGETSAGVHDYAACLEVDSRGNFYYVRGNGGLRRVSRDGSREETFATGFRNPCGMAIGPNDVITVAPQEGEWTPGTSICEVRAGGHYGYLGPQVKPERPLGYDPPLCWLPRQTDNSAGGQVWVPEGRWGPLGGHLLHLSFGRCWPLLVLRETHEGVSQGGVVRLPLDFESGVLRGRFHPLDGQLYVSGMKGWGTSAARDGCFQRVRYTGRSIYLPVTLRVHANGILLGFAQPLDPASCQDPDSFSIERWNYRYAATYGSPEYKVSHPAQEGRDEVEVKSATLMPDGRAVFLELEPLSPVMQMGISYSLRAADGTVLSDTIYNTIHRVPETRIAVDARSRRPRAGALPPEIEQRLSPGLLAHFQQSDPDSPLQDAKPLRLAALRVEPDSAATPWLRVGAFRTSISGYLKAPRRMTVRFQLQGTGNARLSIQDVVVTDRITQVSEADGIVGSRTGRDEFSNAIELHKGFNRVLLDYASPAPESRPNGDPAEAASLRLIWESDSFRAEPVPPGLLWHDSQDDLLQSARQLRAGREAFASRRCVACHGDLSAAAAGIARQWAMPELAADGPSLAGIGSRRQTTWLVQWLLEPQALRANVQMPQLFDNAHAGDRQSAADVAAYLATLVEPREPVAEPPDDSAIEAGLTLYEDLGCLGCHRWTPLAEPDPLDRISLHLVSARFSGGALAEFLASPQRHNPWTGMPDFQLNELESRQLAAYLESVTRPVGTAAGQLPGSAVLQTANIARGTRLFQEKSCGRCHATTAPPSPHSTPLPRVAPVLFRPAAGTTAVKAPADRGCLAAGPANRGVAPGWNFSPAERESLIALLKTDGRSLSVDPAVERSQRWMVQLRCHTCHARDGRYSILPELLAEEGELGRAPDILPSLTWAGEHLRGAWIERTIAGESGKVRPWLRGRMPAFPTHARSLADGLAAEHGLPFHSGKSLVPDPARAELGFRLTQKNGGLDCRQCHGVGSQPPEGDGNAQIALGVNFSLVGQRMRYDYYRRWMFDPLRIDPQTKMPKFASDNGTTKIVTIESGNADSQFDDLWHYLLALPAEPHETTE